MGNLKVGDIVARKSYGGDILFQVIRIKRTGGEEIVTLKGISCRLEADALASDLVVQSDQYASAYLREQMHFDESRHGSIGVASHRGM